MKETIREAHLQLCHWVRLLSQPTTTWSPLHWEFKNPPCSFNVAKTNAICESVYSPWTGGSKKQIQFSDLKKDHLWKKEKTWMTLLKKCDKLSKSVFTDPQHHCASRGNAVPVSRTPPESESHARARVTPESQHFWNDALSPASQLRSKMRWCQQHHQNLLGGKPTTPQGMQKPFPWILETCQKHAFSSVFASHWEDRGWLAVPSTSVCPHWMLKDFPPPPAKGPVVRHKTCDLASMDSSDIKRLPSWNILLRKLSM